MDGTDVGVAIVTGGAQGIGRACAEALRGAGFRIAIWDVDEAAMEEASSALDALTKRVDIRDDEAVARVAEETRNALGAPSALVHSAGVAGANAPVIDYPPEEWRRVIDIDLNGTFNVNRAVAAQMAEAGYGRIVNIASVAGKEGNPNASAYSAAKAGVIALTKSLGKELAGHDIAVNCVTPAAARTRIFEQMTEEHIAYMLSKVPRGRFLRVEEAAAMVTWLCSAENSFTTGGVFDLSGGRATY